MGINKPSCWGSRSAGTTAILWKLLTPRRTAYEITYKGNRGFPRTLSRSNAAAARAFSGFGHGLAGISRGTGDVLRRHEFRVARRPAERVSVSTAANDTVTFEIDASTHLPVSREFRYRDAMFKDIDVDREEYDNYQLRDGVMTPFTVTRYKSGDMVGQQVLSPTFITTWRSTPGPVPIRMSR